MLFTTTTQWIALALTLLAGWLLGLASHPGGRKWRERYATEREAHAAARRDAEARLQAHEARVHELEAAQARHGADAQRLAELERDRAELERYRVELSAARARIAELERSHAAAPVARPAAEPTAAHQAVGSTISAGERRVIRPTGERRGWFDWGPGNDPRARR